MTADVRVRRIYDEPEPGCRVLVDRVWPRGVSKEHAALDEWCQEIAPSTELRKWYGHDPEKFGEFRDRYRTELRDHAETLDHLRKLPRPLILLTATRDVEHSQAAVLAELLGGA